MKYLSEKEAFDIALNLEEEGIRFYEDYSSRVKDQTTRHIFQQLASDERDHYTTFQKLQSEIQSGGDKLLGNNEEVRHYLANLVRPGVFYDVKGVPHASLSKLNQEEVVHIGIQAEKDSILFYTEVWHNSTNMKSRKAFKKILLEERQHLNILLERLMYLKKLKK